MTLWIDAHLSPSIAAWINRNFPAISAKSVRALHLQNASDQEIFEAAREAHATIMNGIDNTRDYCFIDPF